MVNAITVSAAAAVLLLLLLVVVGGGGGGRGEAGARAGVGLLVCGT